MLKAKIKILFSFIILAVVLFLAVPKVYIHNLLDHKHGLIHTTQVDVFNELDGKQDCNFKKFDTPVYYSVFKFILNFLPLKETKQTSFLFKQEPIQKQHYYISSLRGPPLI